MSECYASAVIKTAIAEIGYKEKRTNSQLDDKTANAGGGNYTKYARDFDQKWPNWYNGPKNGFDWCDMFVDWCMVTTFGYKEALRLTCQPEKSAGAGCGYSLGYYRAKGQFHTSNPKPGDQIFFGSSTSDVDHTGLVEKVENGRVYTIEGNTSEMVARRDYSLSNGYIVGYGRPAYDPEPAGGSTATVTAKPSTGSIKVGDVVDFTGNKHYASSTAANSASCKPGRAKVTSMDTGATHPYHLVHIDGTSNVYGWVDAADIGGGTLAEACAKLEKLKVINSPDYWASAAGKVKYLDDLLLKAAAKITKAGTRCASPEEGINALVAAGVISSPDYWKKHVNDLPNLGALLCALGGAVK